MPRSFKTGSFLFKEGDKPTCMYIIKSGNVSVRKSKGKGYVELAQLHTNETVGEVSFIDRQPRSASAMALTDVEALEIDFESLDKVFVQVPDYIRTIMVAVTARLRKADETIRQLQPEVIPRPDDQR